VSLTASDFKKKVKKYLLKPQGFAVPAGSARFIFGAGGRPAGE
jgi:hypothetical protein